jgi:hypothetical protein
VDRKRERSQGYAPCHLVTSNWMNYDCRSKLAKSSCTWNKQTTISTVALRSYDYLKRVRESQESLKKPNKNPRPYPQYSAFNPIQTILHLETKTLPRLSRCPDMFLIANAISLYTLQTALTPPLHETGNSFTTLTEREWYLSARSKMDRA